jgi:hypothetical protein
LVGKEAKADVTSGRDDLRSWNDDVEVGIELVHHPGQGCKRRFVAVELDLSGSGELTGGIWLQHHADQRGFRPGDGQLRIGHRTFTRIEHTALDPRCSGLVQVRKGEIDSEVDLGGLLAIDVDSGEVKQDVDRHRDDGVRAGGSE